MIEQKTVTQLHPRIGRPMSLSVGHIDPDTLTLTFHYQELVRRGKWHPEHRELELERGTHYQIDRKRGIIQLLDHPFWHTEGYWTVAPYTRKGRLVDAREPLLYKGQVKHDRGQYVEATFEHYKPEEVVLRETPEGRDLGVEAKVKAYKRSTKRVATIDINEIDEDAKARLGYDLPRYIEAADPTPEERGKEEVSFDWE